MTHRDCLGSTHLGLSPMAHTAVYLPGFYLPGKCCARCHKAGDKPLPLALGGTMMTLARCPPEGALLTSNVAFQGRAGGCSGAGTGLELGWVQRQLSLLDLYLPVRLCNLTWRPSILCLLNNRLISQPATLPWRKGMNVCLPLFQQVLPLASTAKASSVHTAHAGVQH